MPTLKAQPAFRLAMKPDAVSVRVVAGASAQAMLRPAPVRAELQAPVLRPAPDRINRPVPLLRPGTRYERWPPRAEWGHPPPGRPPGLRRAELSVPVAPEAAPGEASVYGSVDGSQSYALPRYALRFVRVGAVDEPGVSLVDREGVPTLVVSFDKTASPAAAEGRAELPHTLAVTLKYRVPVLDGGSVVQQLAFPTLRVDDSGSIVTAELPLASPGQRQQLIAALSMLEASATFVVGRGIQVAVPNGASFPDTGEPAYAVCDLLIEGQAEPAPLLLSAEQRDRLGGAGTMQPLIRHRHTHQGIGHTYWQDPMQPARFLFLPDRFALARAEDGDRRPMLRVQAAPGSDGAPRLTLQFVARPRVELDRLEAARPALEQAARQRGAAPPLTLELVSDPQPRLLLALPQGGAPSHALVERPGADVDLEAGIVHAETLTLDDFQVVYQSLFGASLSVLRGEVRAASGGDVDDVPVELRLDRTLGALLQVTPTGLRPEGLSARLLNPIESPLRLEALGASARVGDALLPLRVEGLAPGTRLAPGAELDLLLVPEAPLAALPEALALDESAVVVEADPQAIWGRIFDRGAAAQLTREVVVEAVPLLFASPDRPDDRVAAFVVSVEQGGSVRLTEAELRGTTTVRVPIEPLITGAPMPPLRYRTETWWGSGGIGSSAWRESDATILFPVKTPPAP